MRDESLFGNIDKMLELVRVSNTIENDGGVTRGHVAALESIIPGIITSRHSADSFTHGVSDYNNDTAYVCVNQWALENGLPEEGVATESWGSLIKVVGGVGLFAGLIALIHLIVKMFRGGSGGPGGGITSGPTNPDKVVSELDNFIDLVDKEMKSVYRDQSDIKETSKKKVKAIEALVDVVVTAPVSNTADKNIHAKEQAIWAAYNEYSRLSSVFERCRIFYTHAGYGGMSSMRDSKVSLYLGGYITGYRLGALDDIGPEHELFNASIVNSFDRLPSFLTCETHVEETNKYKDYIGVVLSAVVSPEATRAFAELKRLVGEISKADSNTDALLAEIETISNAIPIPPDDPVDQQDGRLKVVCKNLLTIGKSYVTGVHSSVTGVADLLAKIIGPTAIDGVLKTVTELDREVNKASDATKADSHVSSQLKTLSWKLTSVYKDSLKVAMCIHKYALARSSVEKKHAEILHDLLDIKNGEPFIAFVRKYLNDYHDGIADIGSADSEKRTKCISKAAAVMSDKDFADIPKILTA